MWLLLSISIPLLIELQLFPDLRLTRLPMLLWVSSYALCYCFAAYSNDDSSRVALSLILKRLTTHGLCPEKLHTFSRNRGRSRVEPDFSRFVARLLNV